MRARASHSARACVYILYMAGMTLRSSRVPCCSTIELLRDGLLRFLARKVFLYIAVAWLLSVVGWGLTIAFMYLGLFLLPEGALGMSTAQLQFWANVSMQVITALLTYLNGISTPWRLSILIHHLSTRDSSPGHDFYGRPTEAIWFHLPSRSRLIVAICLCCSVVSHFATQATRFVWSDFEASNEMPGLVPINVTAVGSIVFAIAGAIVQGTQESKLKKLHPERYPPGVDQHLKDFYRRWKRKEIRLCSLATLKAFLQTTKEEKAKWVLTKELKRVSDLAAAAAPNPGARPAAKPPSPQPSPRIEVSAALA